MRSHTIRKVENHYKPPLRVFHISKGGATATAKSKKKIRWVVMREKWERGWNTTRTSRLMNP